MTYATYDALIALAQQLTFFLLSLALLLVFIRLALGPTLPDRVVALDLTAIIVVALACVYSVSVEQPIYLDMGIALALVAFLGTVAVARYALREGNKGGPLR